MELLRKTESISCLCNANTASAEQSSLLPAKSLRSKSWRRSGIGFIGSGLMFILIPKCPICLAAYLALFTGAGTALAIAAGIRPLLEVAIIAFTAIVVVTIVVDKCIGRTVITSMLKRR